MPVSLSLTANQTLPLQPPTLTTQNFDPLGILDIGQGAIIDLDPLASLTLKSRTSIVVDGQLSAPAGAISLAITSDGADLTEFVPNQGIWLEGGAALLARGAVQSLTDDRGLVRGTVLDGGTVSISAPRGYIVTAQDSLIDVSGAAADLDIGVAENGRPPLLRQIGSSGGSIQLTAAEGILFNGSLLAQGGDASAAGGSLAVVLNGNLHGNELAGILQPIFPTGPREIVFGGDTQLIVAPRHAIPLQYNGLALLPVSRLQSAGFRSMDFSAYNLIDDIAGKIPGDIRFSGSVELSASASLRLNAPRIVADSGSHVGLTASYVGLGYDDQRDQSGAVARLGTATLDVRGNLVEFIGALGLDGFDSSVIHSSGDIRFRGQQALGSVSLAGVLHAQGALSFDAQQLYPTTFSQFSVLMDGEGDDALTITRAAGEAGAPFSAGGSLTFTADAILQDGEVRAPFGQISMNADRLTVADGSLTSTSAAGLVVPFGTTQAGADWTYQLPLGQSVVFTDSGLPSQRLTLNADVLDVQAGSTVDLSGGGTERAYEFVPGVGGTHDVLANDFVAGQFAVIPGVRLPFGAYDTGEESGFGYHPGDSVYLSGVGGLPAAEYAVLPARYALLPGAYLVRPVSGYTDLQPGETISRLDGSVIVAGYHTIAGTSIRDPRTSGFAIESGAAVKSLARYDIASANTFFASAADAGQGARLPRDSGQLQLIAGSELAFLGALRATPDAGGRGAQVDISADRLQLVDGAGAGSDPSFVSLDVGQLNALGAQSLLVGGLRTNEPGATHIETTASQLVLRPGVELQAPDLTLVARDELALDSGSRIEATGATAASSPEIDLAGSGALLRVSTGGQTEKIVRTGATGDGGSLTLAAGSSLAASGSALIEASGSVDAQATYDLHGGSLAFSVSSLALGPAALSAGGLALSPDALAPLALKDLRLTSASPIDVYGAVSLDIGGTLQISTPELRAMTADAAVDFRADNLRLGGSATAGAGSAGSAVSSAGSLTLAARDTTVLTGGTLTSSGFATTEIGADGQLILGGDGALRADSDTVLKAPLVTASDGTQFAIEAQGAAQIGAPGATTASATLAPGVGARLSIEARRIDVASRIDLPSGIVSLVATGPTSADGVTLQSGSSIDVAGIARTFDGVAVAAPGGEVRLESRSGGIALADSSTLDVSAAGAAGDAGRIAILAANGAAQLDGTLLGTEHAGARGARVEIDALQLPDLGQLNEALNGTGFTGARWFRQRGAGDLTMALGAAGTICASDVRIDADGGALSVSGNIDASGTSGGQVALAARDRVTVTGSVLAAATGAGEQGGSVSLSSEQSGVWLNDSAVLDVSGGAGGAGGEVRVRTPRAALLTVADGDPGNDQVHLGATIDGVSEISIEGFERYASPSGVIGASEVAASAANPWYADAADFSARAADILGGLGRSADPSTMLVAGIEIDSAGDLTLASDWNLANWRFNGLPGVLTLRAAGDLAFQKSLSDGFAAITGAGAFVLPDVPDRSWSYRLIAGADLGASNVLQVATGGDRVAHNLTVAPGKISTATQPPVPVMVRTGTGDIDIAASGNLVLGNRASVVYTAGANSMRGIALDGLGTNLRLYPDRGGDIEVDVGGNVVGARTNQLVTDWLWRTGQATDQFRPAPTGWNVNYQRFESGIGALAGGDVSIRAGGDIRDLSVAIATIGRQVGSATSAADSVVEISGGGRLEVDSGGDITGGSYFVGRGSAALNSDGIFGADAALPGGLAPVLAIGDAGFSVVARDELQLEAALNPFLLPQGRSQGASAVVASFFATYGGQSALNLLSTAGNVELFNEPSVRGLIGTLTSMSGLASFGSSFTAYPGTVRATAFSGDLRIGGANGMALWPAARGQLELFADKNIDLSQLRVLSMSDTDPDSFLGLAHPDRSIGRLTAAVYQAPLPLLPHVPIHSADFGSSGSADPDPARIVALTGDVNFGGSRLAYIPKPLHLIAGRDINDPWINVEHFDDASLSLVSAGRDIRESIGRDATGRILVAASGFNIEGPGQLAIEAGGGIDLGASTGVTTLGDISNPALPAGGADISLLAGIAGNAPDVERFAKRYLADGHTYDDALLAFVRQRVDGSIATKAEALAAFATLSTDVRYQFLQGVLFGELRAGGRAAANSSNNDYSRSFTALETMFPGSTSSDANPYHGDISLFFSRVYTLDGGSIALAAPGGSVNVGLATPPAAFGLNKQPSDLGIVAQGTGDVSSMSFGDFQVNESRVFAADGGDILVWATDGDIDAGRGAKTAISAPPPTTTFDATGKITTIFPAALTGSGIQALATSEDRKPGDVDLFAPRGVVNAGDAGIVAGNLTIGATAVLGRDNIQVSGVSVGVPVDSGGLGASLAGASSVASSASNAASMAVETSGGAQAENAPLASGALSWLDVFVTGLGEENCKPDDLECLKRQKAKEH
jgi:hypothetical protein